MLPNLLFQQMLGAFTWGGVPLPWGRFADSSRWKDQVNPNREQGTSKSMGMLEIQDTCARFDNLKQMR